MIADTAVGLYIVMAILAAVVHKQKTRLGQAIDVPMVDTMIAFDLVEHLSGNTVSPADGDFGGARVLVPERVPHRTADRWICITTHHRPTRTTLPTTDPDGASRGQGDLCAIGDRRLVGVRS